METPTRSLLVVEDSKSLGEVLHRRLAEALGVEVVWARSLAEATRAVAKAKTPFSLGILDLNLPDALDGEIVGFVLGRGIPGIVLTSEYHPELRDRILAQGVLDYFIKDNINVVNTVIHFIRRFFRNHRTRVLVVDDSRSARRALMGLLQRYGFELLEAASGEEALRMLAVTTVRIALVDYQMPGMDGFQLIRHMRGRFSPEEMAIIGLSGHDKGDLASRLLKAGANDFLAKPFRNEELLCRVFQVIDAIDHQHEMAGLLKRQENLAKRHRAILDHALDAIITTDRQGRVVDFNPAAEALFGFEKGATTGRPVHDLIIPPHLRKRYQRAIARWTDRGGSAAAGLKRRLEVPGIHASGGAIDLEIALTAVNLDDDIQFTAFLHDTTQRHQLLKSLEEALQAAESASRAKSEFIANTSHEIRTPMNAIIGFTELALKTELSPRLADYLGKVRKASHTLMGLIDDILDFSKMEAGKLELDPVVFDLQDMVDHLAELFSMQTTEKGIELVFHAPVTTHRALYGDAQRLEQILINLIRNAIKFTDSGTIAVRITLHDTTPGGVEFHCQVEDTGIGVDPERLPHLFQPFVQADGSTTRRFGGTGLGLTICKRLVELMAGTIQAESTPGVGSTFSFRLPLESRPPLHADPLAVTRRFRGMQVLVVDDNTATREMLIGILSSFGMEPIAVGSGEAAMAEALTAQTAGRPFPLILMDWRLPGEDGIAVTRTLWAHQHATSPTIARTKVIMLTAFGDEETEQEACAAGIDAFIHKPVTRSQILDAIQRVFGEQPPRRDHTARMLAEEAETTSKIGGARILLAEDNEINQQVARGLLERVGLSVEIAGNGQEVLRLLDRNTYEAVLLDIQMPVMDGLETARRLRADPRFRTLPLIAMTAHAMADDKRRCLEAGMNDHLAKPIRPERLYGLLSRLVGPLLVTPQPVAATMAEPAIEIPELPGLDRDDGLSRVGGDRALYRRLLLHFHEEQAGLPERIAAALANNDNEGAARLVHTVKGAAGNLGAVLLQRAATGVELALKHGKDPQPALAAFTAQLNPLLQSLASLADTDDEPTLPNLAAPIPAATRARLAPTLQKLAQHLADYSLAAQDVLGEIRHDPALVPFDKGLQRVAAQLEHYAFEQARESLARIAERLGLSLEGNDA
ncbi:MAG: response regulator [Magnetococcales bacterium]|nr:response regulator [Magnetococcales bacterium]